LSRTTESMRNEKDVGEQNWGRTLISYGSFYWSFYLRLPVLQRASWALLLGLTPSLFFLACRLKHNLLLIVVMPARSSNYVCNLRYNEVLCIDVII
jgi:hypothetical protein